MKALASVLLILVSLVGVLYSDVKFRAGNLDGHNGIDAHSYDVVCTILLIVGTVSFVYAIFFDN